MDSSFTLYLGRHTLETALLLSAPILLTCIIVGVVITILQAVTSIRDMTITICNARDLDARLNRAWPVLPLFHYVPDVTKAGAEIPSLEPSETSFLAV